MLVIDTNTDCTPHTGTLKARGVTTIGRYYASSKWKRISATEAKALSNAGFRLVAVFEDSGKPPLSVEAGEHDARIALGQANAVGQTPGSCIYFAMENLPNGYNASHLPGLKAYFQGVNNILKERYAVGAYSNGLTLAALLEAGLIRYAWVSASTSFAGSKEFLKTDRWHLAQRLIDKDWDGVSVDTNDCRGDFGSWALPAKDIVDETVRQMVQAPAAGAVAGAGVSVLPTVPAPSEPVPVEAKPKRDMAYLNEIADQGSRLAGHIKAAWTSIKLALGIGTGGTVVASTLVDTNKGNAAVATGWGQQHPWLMLLIGAVIVLAVIGGILAIFFPKIIAGLVSAYKDGRYFARGETPAKPKGA